MLDIGSLVDGKYKIRSKVGQGGMSVVYLAHSENPRKQWAVKVVRKDGIKDFEVVRQGLVAEMEILKKLNHPSLPGIADVIDFDDSFIIVMDYIEGTSLEQVLREQGAQPEREVIELGIRICDVLHYLHTRTPAIIYRDMKPANIMRRPDGNIVLIDFGTAREFAQKNTADTVCLGTVGYAAPEQYGSRAQTDERTDIYCLGATLYHLVTGKNPCEAPGQFPPVRKINPGLSAGLEWILLKCTQRDPNDRYRSAAELKHALEKCLQDNAAHRKKQKRRLRAFITTGVLSLVPAVCAVGSFFAARQEGFAMLSGEILRYAYLASLIAWGAMLALTVILFFALGIPGAIRYLWGSKTEKGHGSGKKKREKPERNRKNKKKQAPAPREQGSKPLKAAPVYPMNETVPPAGMGETVRLDSPTAYRPEASDASTWGDVVVEYEITFIHTNEVIG